MTTYLVVWASAAFASCLTLPSGFGLGTLLMPVFALFFPVDLAIATASVVHLFDNLFKFVLFGKHAEKMILWRFGLPAIIGAFIGGRALFLLSGMPSLFSYAAFGQTFYVQPVKVIVALLLASFALFELIPRLRDISFGDRFLAIGGGLSGFFGGLSGHQGALRSAFLVRAGLSKEAFIGTGTAVACLVDLSRLSVYSAYFSQEGVLENGLLLVGAILSAFLGAFVAGRVVRQVTLKFVRIAVTVMLFAVAFALGTGLI
ncbi:MAG: Sulfite exporter TauE/SafE [Syntrophorhabdaceae bacterium PtaU1.Bin034]|jgi:uncharacterized membrane protein YfcA|nr:MAG: Sulfite exporter TauE/SafE [Syntrophorhabdaceae bacterium PtaU1.Bin034]